jgi:hypothetical protein
LKEKRAEYGDEIVVTLSRQLALEFGRGFTEKNVRRMVQFAEAFPDEQIVATLSRQLGWSHFVELIPLNKHLQRDFYAEMCRIEGWSVRLLRRKIGGMLYERTALSRKPAKLAEMELKQLREEDKLTPDLVFRDPYFLDFLGLKGTYSEKDLSTTDYKTAGRTGGVELGAAVLLPRCWHELTFAATGAAWAEWRLSAGPGRRPRA